MATSKPQTKPQTKPSINSSRTVTCSDSGSMSSNNLTRSNTVFYSLDNNDLSDSTGDNKKKRSQFETSEDDRDTIGSDDTIELKRKQSKINHDPGEVTSSSSRETEPVTSTATSSQVSATQYQQQQDTKSNNNLDMPDWHNNYKAWAFLQSQNRDYDSVYLINRENMAGGRSGYVLGRSPDSDIV